LLDILFGLLPLVSLALLIASYYHRELSLLEAAVIGALGWGLAAVTSLELLGLASQIDLLSLIIFWLLVSIGAIITSHMQQKKGLTPLGRNSAARDGGVHAQTGDRLHVALAASAAAIAAVTTTVALVAAPNSWDSLTYHLPRVEQWIQEGSLAHFPTASMRQLASNPFAEMLILHFRLLVERDCLDNLVQ